MGLGSWRQSHDRGVKWPSRKTSSLSEGKKNCSEAPVASPQLLLLHSQFILQTEESKIRSGESTHTHTQNDLPPHTHTLSLPHTHSLHPDKLHYSRQGFSLRRGRVSLMKGTKWVLILMRGDKLKLGWEHTHTHTHGHNSSLPVQHDCTATHTHTCGCEFHRADRRPSGSSVDPHPGRPGELFTALVWLHCYWGSCRSKQLHTRRTIRTCVVLCFVFGSKTKISQLVWRMDQKNWILHCQSTNVPPSGYSWYCSQNPNEAQKLFSSH